MDERTHERLVVVLLSILSAISLILLLSSGNPLEHIKSANPLGLAIFLLTLAMPAIFHAMYERFGRDDAVAREEPDMPSKRKPWLVNLIFHGTVGEMDGNGVISLLLWLERKGKIALERRSGRLFARLLDSSGLEGPEKTVAEELMEGDAELTGLLLRGHSVLPGRGRSVMERIKKCCRDMKKEFVERSIPKAAITGVSGAIVILLSFLYPMMDNISRAQTIILFFQLLTVSLAPQRLFERWKREALDEAIKWEGFGKFLASGKHAMLSRGKEWMRDAVLYAIALGKFGDVEEAMEEMGMGEELEKINAVFSAYDLAYMLASGRRRWWS